MSEGRIRELGGEMAASAGVSEAMPNGGCEGLMGSTASSELGL